jgi:hypothetical protein
MSEDQPIPEEARIPMSFIEINNIMQKQMEHINQLQLPVPNQVMATLQVVIGGINEILYTLNSMHPERKPIIVPGAHGNG